MRFVPVIVVAFLLGSVFTAMTLDAVLIRPALAGDRLLTTTQGYTYNSDTGRAEVELDVFMESCRGQRAVITVSADRKEAEIACYYAGITYARTRELPVYMGNPQFAVVWSR